MLPYRRADRVGREILQEVAMIVGSELDDPRLIGVTITRVELSDDLRNAKIFFSKIGTEAEWKAAKKGLEQASGRFKKGISRMGLRYVPKLLFIHDRGLEHSQRIEEILQRIHQNEPRED